jgi:hypothetical protein
MKRLLVVAFLPLLADPAAADEIEALVHDYVMSEITVWATDPTLVEAIRAQNAVHSSLTQDDIGGLDAAWQAEVGGSDTPVISAVLQSPASEFLREKKDASAGVISEAFIVDAVGLNVAASDLTSDFWQGDEAKYQKTFSVGPSEVFVDEVEFDESSQTYQSQASMTIADPDTGEAIGVLTIGVDVEALM